MRSDETDLAAAAMVRPRSDASVIVITAPDRSSDDVTSS
jgi:hypothetical protein